jgi:hypothetical protein
VSVRASSSQAEGNKPAADKVVSVTQGCWLNSYCAEHSTPHRSTRTTASSQPGVLYLHNTHWCFRARHALNPGTLNHCCHPCCFCCYGCCFAPQALSGLLAAAMLVTSSGPALAASYKPNTVYNNTDFVVEAHFNYKQVRGL